MFKRLKSFFTKKKKPDSQLSYNNFRSGTYDRQRESDNSFSGISTIVLAESIISDLSFDSSPSVDTSSSSSDSSWSGGGGDFSGGGASDSF